MSIVESLQGLSLDAKALLAVLALLWLSSEVRHARRHRGHREHIQRLQMGGDAAERPVLEAHRLPDVVQGAALTLGEMIPRGAGAGQHFVGAISNAGPRAAEAIQVIATLGAHRAEVVSAPPRLAPRSNAVKVEVRLPFGFLTAADVSHRLQAGEPLRMSIGYADDLAVPHVLEQCFTFRRPPANRGATERRWISKLVSCPGGAT